MLLTILINLLLVGVTALTSSLAPVVLIGGAVYGVIQLALVVRRRMQRQA